MKKCLFILAFGIACISASAQNTWSNNIAQMMYDNCTSCHNPKGIAPFSLLEYNQAKSMATYIGIAVAGGQMPPWIADKNYQTYAHERVLSTTEKAAILDWVQKGSPEGEASKTPPPPVYGTKGFISQKPDLEIKLPVYSSKATSSGDDYVCFSMPTNLTTNKKIRGFEVIPGNHAIVHHALVYIDESGTYKTDTSFGVCTGPTKGLIGGYVPGAPPTVFPTNGTDFNLGYEMKAGSNVVLAMHYPEGSFGEVDSTIIRFWFYDDNTTIRNITTRSLIENWSFILPPNQKTPVSKTFNTGGNDYSVLSVFPHMHLLGETITSFAITPKNDTLKFVDIPHWDFEWQEFLFFKNIIKVPAGSTIHGRGTYDNTTGNSHNPNKPPKQVFPGLNTTDEMFLIYFHYLPYETGDENRDIEALTRLSVKDLVKSEVNVDVYPNPSSSQVTFAISEEQLGSAQIRIYSTMGELVASALPVGLGKYQWTISEGVAKGVYYYSINQNGKLGNGVFMVK